MKKQIKKDRLYYNWDIKKTHHLNAQEYEKENSKFLELILKYSKEKNIQIEFDVDGSDESHYTLDVVIYQLREETDDELEQRKKSNEAFLKRSKERRREQYLKLKQEFDESNN